MGRSEHGGAAPPRRPCSRTRAERAARRRRWSLKLAETELVTSSVTRYKVQGTRYKYIGKDVLKAVVRKETLGKQWRDEITEELMRDDFAGLPAVSRRAGRCGSDMVHLLARRRSTICCLRWRITLWESRGSILLMIVVLRAHCLAGRAEGT